MAPVWGKPAAPASIIVSLSFLLEYCPALWKNKLKSVKCLCNSEARIVACRSKRCQLAYCVVRSRGALKGFNNVSSRTVYRHCAVLICIGIMPFMLCLGVVSFIWYFFLHNFQLLSCVIWMVGVRPCSHGNLYPTRVPFANGCPRRPTVREWLPAYRSRRIRDRIPQDKIP